MLTVVALFLVTFGAVTIVLCSTVMKIKSITFYTVPYSYTNYTHVHVFYPMHTERKASKKEMLPSMSLELNINNAYDFPSQQGDLKCQIELEFPIKEADIHVSNSYNRCTLLC